MEEILFEPVITVEDVRKAEEVLIEYRSEKAELDNRLIANEKWYRLRHWEEMRQGKKQSDPEPASAWLLNCIANKHADAMDNFPKPYVLPREESDTEDAQMLSDILPVILEQNEYEQVYSDVWWSKLKGGTGVTGVFWNSSKHGGLGDVDIRKIDLMNLYWEPGITDIQSSRNVFYVKSVENDVLTDIWPFLNGKLTGGRLADAEYEAGRKSTEKSVVVDWYYKKRINGCERVHFVKFVCGQLLYASENDPKYRLRGYYDHGQYPFVFDVQFVEADSPAGFGYIDVCKQPQMYIDRLNQVILKSAMLSASPRFFIRSDGAINEQEYADWSRDFVHYQGGSSPQDSIKQIDVRGVDGSLLSILKGKIDELKETSGNRDFSQGASSAGVTAASAIMALQDAGGKLARDMLKSSYRAFTRMCNLIIELIRQFYDEPRCFRITGDGNARRFVRFSNARIRMHAQGEFGVDMGLRAPVFDIRVRAQRSQPMLLLKKNELAKEFYQLGFFRPENAQQALICMEMMEFEGKEEMKEQISKIAREHQESIGMQESMMKMARILDAQNGTDIANGLQAAFEIG
ncbi:MAG: hypothetical protein IJC48_09100 [Clostridia bacterium]|nr:hypothetical protein [Clostridia bacterium]